ncbi:MAG: MFS transporter [Deltaproteobacteria bacterium]|jgi:MFS family permease|nr:MFS transporter [Deltaproteobacteria bacterium]
MKPIVPILALLLSVAILLTGQGLQSVLLPVRAQIEDLSTLIIGAMGSAYFLGFAVGCVMCPYLVKRVGHIRGFVTMTAVASAAPLVHLMWISPLGWILTRSITGMSFAALYVIIESWLNDRSTNESRGFVLSVYMVINLTVITAGQLMLMLSEPADFHLFALASILVSIAAIPVALTREAQPPPLEVVRFHPMRIISISPVAFVTCAGIGLANGSWWALGPVFASGEQPDATLTAIFMSACVIGGAIGQWPLGRISDRMDRRRVIIGAALLAALTGLALLHAKTHVPHLLYAVSALWGAAAFPIYALAVAHANDAARREELVEVSSGLLLTYAAGAVVGPVIASSFMQTFGPGALFVHTTVVHLGLAGFTLAWLRRKPAIPFEDRAPFAESLQSAKTFSTAFDSARLVEETPDPKR